MIKQIQVLLKHIGTKLTTSLAVYCQPVPIAPGKCPVTVYLFPNKTFLASTFSCKTCAIPVCGSVNTLEIYCKIIIIRAWFQLKGVWRSFFFLHFIQHGMDFFWKLYNSFFFLFPFLLSFCIFISKWCKGCYLQIMHSFNTSFAIFMIGIIYISFTLNKLISSIAFVYFFLSIFIHNCMNVCIILTWYTFSTTATS